MDTALYNTHHLRVGQAGVYRVASELLMRDVDVFLPAVDCAGVDLVTAAGVRIQVKTARLRQTKQYRNGLSYGFSFGYAQKGSRQTAVRRDRLYSEEVDYIVLWGMNEDRFWIAPSHIFDNHHCLLLAEGRTSSHKANGAQTFAPRVYTYENRWDLLLPESKVQSTSLPLRAVG